MNLSSIISAFAEVRNAHQVEWSGHEVADILASDTYATHAVADAIVYAYSSGRDWMVDWDALADAVRDRGAASIVAEVIAAGIDRSQLGAVGLAWREVAPALYGRVLGLPVLATA